MTGAMADGDRTFPGILRQSRFLGMLQKASGQPPLAPSGERAIRAPDWKASKGQLWVLGAWKVQVREVDPALRIAVRKRCRSPATTFRIELFCECTVLGNRCSSP